MKTLITLIILASATLSAVGSTKINNKITLKINENITVNVNSTELYKQFSLELNQDTTEVESSTTYKEVSVEVIRDSTDNKNKNIIVTKEVLVNFDNDTISNESSKSVDTIKIVAGNRELIVIDNTTIEGNSDVNIEIKEKEKKKRDFWFDGHWESSNIGYANYVTPNNDLNLPPSHNFLTLNSTKSWAWSANVGEVGINIIPKYLGLVSGIGFEFTSLRFDNANNITKDATGNIIAVDYSYFDEIKKSKLTTWHVNVPLLLEAQIPVKKNKSIFVAGGVIGGLKIYSRTKVKAKIDGEKQKIKNKGDFSLNPLRYGFTARCGYDDFGIYATYYVSEMFQTGKSIELNPLSIGISFGF